MMYPSNVADFIRFQYGREPYVTERAAKIALAAKAYKQHAVVGRAQALREGIASGKVTVLKPPVPRVPGMQGRI